MNCIICKHPGEVFYTGIQDCRFATAGAFNLKHCRYCNLFWLDPRPDKEALDKSYDYYVGYGDSLSLTFRSILKKAVLKRYRRLRVKAGLVIDVGCGTGEYLEMMQQSGWQILGIEPNSLAASIAKAKGIALFQGTVEEARLPDAIARQIRFHHSFEHLPDPISTLGECFRILKAGGRIIIRAPNMDSLGHRFFRRHWFALDAPRHLFGFSPRSIRLLFKKYSFRKFTLRTLPKRAGSFYDSSTFISRGHMTGRQPIPVQRGRRCFMLKEYTLCFLGREVGEEMEVVAFK